MYKKILLIGGGGYIGSVIAQYFLDKGYKVLIYDLFIYDNSFIIKKINNKNLEVVNIDFCDSKSLIQNLSGVNYAVILGGLVGDPITKKYPEESQAINLIGIKKLFLLLSEKNIERLIFISTCSNYGLVNNNIKADENTDLKPLSLYAKHKVDAEKFLMSLKGKVDYVPTILRFATAFGLSERMRFDLTVNEFTYELFKNNKLSIYDENTWRPYCHVKDFARLIDIVISSPKNKVSFEIFNAGGQSNHATKKQIVSEITSFIDSSNVSYSSNGSDPRNYIVNFNKVKNILDFIPKFSIRDGIEEILNALNHNEFIDIDSNKNRYGNYNINYQLHE